MKVPSFREFTLLETSIEAVRKYLGVEMAQNLRELATILNKLTFSDNFESFEITCTIVANTELAIRNELRGGTIPTKRLIVRGDAYSPYIVDGDTAWTAQFLYLKNTHATQDATATLLFLK